MKLNFNNFPLIAAVAVLSFTLTGCEVIGDIFKAGIWVGIIAVVIFLAIIGFIANMFRR